MFVPEGNVYRYYPETDEDYLEEWYVKKNKDADDIPSPSMDGVRFSIGSPSDSLNLDKEFFKNRMEEMHAERRRDEVKYHLSEPPVRKPAPKRAASKPVSSKKPKRSLVDRLLGRKKEPELIFEEPEDTVQKSIRPRPIPAPKSDVAKSISEPETQPRFSISIPPIGSNACQSEDVPISIVESKEEKIKPVKKAARQLSLSIDSSYSEEERRILTRILKDLNKLYKMGFTQGQVMNIIASSTRPSHVLIDKDFRILLTDIEIEIEMLPLAKLVFMLYLNHPEGIPFKMLGDYKEEMLQLYQKIQKRELTVKENASVERLCNPFDNSINEKVSHIKQAFISKLEMHGFSSEPYVISGKPGTAKRIELDRKLVIQAVV